MEEAAPACLYAGSRPPRVRCKQLASLNSPCGALLPQGLLLRLPTLLLHLLLRHLPGRHRRHVHRRCVAGGWHGGGRCAERAGTCVGTHVHGICPGHLRPPPAPSSPTSLPPCLPTLRSRSLPFKNMMRSRHRRHCARLPLLLPAHRGAGPPAGHAQLPRQGPVPRGRGGRGRAHAAHQVRAWRAGAGGGSRQAGRHPAQREAQAPFRPPAHDLE